MTDEQYLKSALRHVLLHPGRFRRGFDDWLLDNLHVQRRFDVEALHVASTGRTYYSAYTIVEYLRHHTALRGRGEDFKINNLWRASMARLFADMHPQHKDLFKYRT
jgi:hypothetical protein